jgi:hypothetical protein
MNDLPFLDVALLGDACRTSPIVLPWPRPGNPGGILSISNAAEWRDFMQRSVLAALAIRTHRSLRLTHNRNHRNPNQSSGNPHLRKWRTINFRTALSCNRLTAI